MKPLVEIMGDIVARVSSKLTAQLKAEDKAINAVNYMYGHWNEICNKLTDMTKSAKEAKYKFPLIVLLEDIPISGNVATMQILIFHYTNKNFDSAKRQAVNFNPILYPIRDQLYKEIGLSSYFLGAKDPTQFDMTYWDRKYFGKEAIYGNEGLILNEYLDVIQLQDFKLTLNKQKC